VLGQPVEAEALVEKGGDDLADRVVPLVASGVRQTAIAIGVRDVQIVDVGLGLLEVGVLDS
jgi:hypothetical protein